LKELAVWGGQTCSRRVRLGKEENGWGKIKEQSDENRNCSLGLPAGTYLRGG